MLVKSYSPVKLPTAASLGHHGSLGNNLPASNSEAQRGGVGSRAQSLAWASAKFVPPLLFASGLILWQIATSEFPHDGIQVPSGLALESLLVE